MIKYLIVDLLSLSAVAGMYHALKSGLAKDDTYLSYLPLNVRLEYNLVNAFFVAGVTVGFGTDLEQYILSAPLNPNICPASYGDAASFCPSILFGIKPWWDIIHSHLIKSIESRPEEERAALWRWIEKKRDALRGYLFHLAPMIDKWGQIADLRTEYFGSRIRWVGMTCPVMTQQQRELLGLVFGGPKGIMVECWSIPSMHT
jgi:long-chain acyl-CoA synthetase